MTKLGSDEITQQKQRQNQQFTPGQLKFGDFKSSSRKLIIKSFFVNPDTEVFSLRFDQNDELIAAGCSDGTVKIYDLQSNKMQFSLNTQCFDQHFAFIQYKYSQYYNDMFLSRFTKDDQTPTTSLRWRPTYHCSTKQVLVTVNADGSIIHWHAQSGKPLHKMSEKDQGILCLDYNKEGSKFATSGNDFHVRVYDEDSKSVIIDFEPADWNQPGHSNRVFGVKFVEDDPNLLLSSGWDTNLHIWDLRQKQSIAAFYGPSVSGDAVDYKDGVILTGSYRNKEQIQTWDLGTRKLIQQIQWEQGYKTEQAYVYSVQFAKDNKDIIAGCAGINELKIFSYKNQYKPCASIIEQREGIYSVEYGKTHDKFAFGGGEGVVYIMNINE